MLFLPGWKFSKNNLKEKEVNSDMGFITGLLIGSSITLIILGVYRHIKRIKPTGTFIIDLSDPMKDICRLELDESLENIYKKDQIVFNVKTISQQ